MSVTPPPFNYPLHISNSLNRSNDYLKGTPNGIPGIAQQLPSVQDPAARKILEQLTNALNSTNHAVLSLANTSNNIENPESLERQVVAKPALMYLA